MTLDLEHVPPHDLEAECALLSAWMSGVPGVCAGSIVPPEDFYGDLHRLVARACVSLHDDGVTPDAWAVVARLRQDNGTAKLKAIANDFATIASVNASPGTAEHYAGIVTSAAAARRAAQIAYQIKQDIQGGQWSRDLISQRARELEQAATDERDTSVGWAKDVATQAHDDILAVRDWRDGSADVLSWGVSELDRIGCVIRPSGFPVVAGAPGSGKTTWLLTWAFRTAHRTGRPVVFLSLEMDPQELARKAMLGWAGIPDPQYRGVSQEHRDLLAEARDWVASTPVLLPRRFPGRLESLCGWIHRVAAAHNPAAFVVDYLGLVRAPGTSSYEKTTEASKRLRATARSTRVPIIAAHQLNRRAMREKELPALHDLRDSGQIEQDATEVIMIHRPWTVAPAEAKNAGRVDKHEAWLVVRKNRHGENDRKVRMRFEPETSRLLPVDDGGGDV